MPKNNRTSSAGRERPRLTPVDYDNDPQYRAPRGWARAKAALGDIYYIREFLLQLEDLCLDSAESCPRLLLAVALFDFLRKGKDEKERACERYSAWFCTPEKRLTLDEYQAAREALRRIMSEPDRRADDGPEYRAAA